MKRCGFNITLTCVLLACCAAEAQIDQLWKKVDTTPQSNNLPRMALSNDKIAGGPSDPLQFIPVTPCRVADTRSQYGGGGPIQGGTHQDFTIAGPTCGIPASAAAFSLNVSVIPRGSLRYLTVWAAGQPQPVTTTMNSLDGRIKNNAAIVAAGTAKAIFSNQVGLIERNVRLGAPARGDDSLQATLQHNQLKFTLSDFKTGDITGNNNPLISIGSDSTGKQVLYMTLSYSSYTSEDSPGVKIEGRSLQVGWMPGPSNPATPAALKTLPISLIARDGGWTKYVTYHVVAEFQGKALEYQAFFVFDGNGKASARDPFVQNNGLDDLITASVYPMMLLRTPYRENPNVLKWLKANQLSTPSCQSGEVCCDTTTMKCGILPSDLKDELERKPVGSE